MRACMPFNACAATCSSTGPSSGTAARSPRGRCDRRPPRNCEWGAPASCEHPCQRGHEHRLSRNHRIQRHCHSLTSGRSGVRTTRQPSPSATAASTASVKMASPWRRITASGPRGLYGSHEPRSGRKYNRRSPTGRCMRSASSAVSAATATMSSAGCGGARVLAVVKASCSSRRWRFDRVGGVPASTSASSDMPTKNGRGGGSVMIKAIDMAWTSSRLPTSSSQVRAKIDIDRHGRGVITIRPSLRAGSPRRGRCGSGRRRRACGAGG